VNLKFILMSFFLTCFSVFETHAQLKSTSYKDGNQKLTGLSGIPTNPRTDIAGILILPAWKGIQSHEKEVANQLTAMGYHTFVADIYGEGNYPTNSNEAGTIAGNYKKNVTEYQKRIHLALDELIKGGAAKGRIVIIGYCFGGTGALEAARSNMPVEGVVSFHGGLDRDTTSNIGLIKPRILVCHGADDPYVGKKGVENFEVEMRAAKADWQMNIYANAVHAFTDKSAGNDNSKGAAYNQKADQRSWEDFMTFLKDVLGK